jgi:hypothetical protein
MSQEQEELRRLRAAAQALVDALPICDLCESVATAEDAGGVLLYCRECSSHGADDVEYAAELRALLALLDGEP